MLCDENISKTEIIRMLYFHVTIIDYSCRHFGLSHFAVNGAYVWAAQNGLMLNGDGINDVIPAKHKF